MVTAFEAGVISMIMRSNLDSLLTARIITQLTDDYFIAEEKAHWAAELWTDAYYFFQHGALRKAAPPAARPAAPKQAPPRPAPTQKPVAAPPPPKPAPINPAPISAVLKETDPSCFEVEENGTGYCIRRYIGGNDKQVVIPAWIDGKLVTEIGDHVFSGYNSLTAITIPDSVTEINMGAFHGCTSLTSITMPDSVTKIGERAFEGCTKLTIYAPAGSYVKTYARIHNIPFRTI